MAFFSDIGKSFARIVLPKSWEYRLGITQRPMEFPIGEGEADEERAQRTLLGIKEEDLKGVQPLTKRPSFSAEFRDEAAERVKLEIQSGTFDKEKIKNSLKSLAKQKVNEAILKKRFDEGKDLWTFETVKGRPAEYAKDVFDKDWGRNAKEIVQGIGVLLGMGSRRAWEKLKHPIKTTKQEIEFAKNIATSPEYREEIYEKYIDPIVEEYKEYRHPFQKLAEDPLDVFLDATAIASLGGMAGIKPLEKASKVLSIKNVSNTTKNIIKKVIPDGENLIKNIEVAKGTRKLLQKEAVAHLSSRARIINEINSTINKLSKEEAAILPRIVEGFSKPPPGTTNEFQRAVGLIRSLAADQEKFGYKVGSLTPEVVQRRKFQPLAKFLESEKKFEFPAKGVKTLDVKIPTKNYGKIRDVILDKPSKDPFSESIIFSKVKSAPIDSFTNKQFNRKFVDKILNDIRAGKQIEPIIVDGTRIVDGNHTATALKELGFDDMPVVFMDDYLASKASLISSKYNNFVGGKTIKGEKAIPWEKLTGDNLRRGIESIKTFFPDADPIYMRHFFEDTPANFSKFFLNTQPVRSFKPGFLKKSYGVEGYIGAGLKTTKKELKDILTRQSVENLKWQRNIDLINKVKESPYVKPLKAGEQLLPGYKVFAPDGLLRFYRGTINLTDTLKKNINVGEDVFEVFTESIKKAFPDLSLDEIKKSYLGVTKSKVYQVPDAMANQLSKITKSGNSFVKLFWDKPIDAFRFAALGLMPRWNVNNIVGNTIFSIMTGDIFTPKLFIQSQRARKQGLLPDELFGGLHQVERTTSGKLGPAAEIPLVKSSIALHDKLLNTKVIGPIVKNIEKAVNWSVFKPLQKIGNWSFKANQYIDELFKGVGYISAGLKADRKSFMQRSIASFEDVEKMLKKTGKNAAKVDELVEGVHKWYYHGLNLTDVERRVVRKIIPFYSWMRWITEYSYRVATEAPVRANIIKNSARSYYMMTGQNELPSWLRGAVPLGNDEDGTVYYLKTTGMNPFDTITDLMSEGVAGLALQSSAPGIKTFVERATGKEIFLGRQFTKEGIIQSFSGQLYKVDPETGKAEVVEETIKPKLMEHLLRNYVPQYLLMETILTGGRQRYTAEGLDTILSDLFKEEKDRKAIIKDVITHQGVEKKKFWNEIGKALGINIQETEPEQILGSEKAVERATTQALYRELPLLNPRFKLMVRERMAQEIAEGTPKEEIKAKLEQWLLINAEELKKLK